MTLDRFCIGPTCINLASPRARRCPPCERAHQYRRDAEAARPAVKPPVSRGKDKR